MQHFGIVKEHITVDTIRVGKGILVKLEAEWLIFQYRMVEQRCDQIGTGITATHLNFKHPRGGIAGGVSHRYFNSQGT